MNLTTLFSAYTKCFYEIMDARGTRGTTFGIAVDSDFWARRFQKLQRLAKRLEAKLNKALKKMDQQKQTGKHSHGSD